MFTTSSLSGDVAATSPFAMSPLTAPELAGPAPALGQSLTDDLLEAFTLDLPATSAELPCQVSDSLDLWFAERGDDVEAAKAMCRECPLRAECLAGAVRRHEPWGVWGGEVFVDGVVVARKRGRGRPRKIAA